jgi:hypothetical protein
MLAKVTNTLLPILLNDSRYTDDGFAMLDRYIKVIDPDSDANRMLALEKLVNFDLPESKYVASGATDLGLVSDMQKPIWTQQSECKLFLMLLFCV